MMIAPVITDPYCDERYSGNEARNHPHEGHESPHHHSEEDDESSDADSDEDDSKDGGLCVRSDRCVSSCAAYGRVCPASARSAAQAVHEKILKITQGSRIFESGPPDFERIDSDDIAKGEKLGEGGFSFVNSCVLKNRHDSSGASEMFKENAYAVKYLKRKIMVDVRHFRHGAADLATEAFFLGALDHPNIVKLHGVTAGSCESNVASGKDGGFFIVVDRLHETLDKRIEKWRKQVEAQPSNLFHRLSKDYREKQKSMLCERLRVALDITTAMAYLHNLNVAYRDLKPDNVGFSVDGTLKMFDFGLAKEEKPSEADEYGTFRMTGQTGSRRYMAPEVAQDKPYNKSVDVYSFGILLWEMCSLQKPFAGYTSKKHMAHVVLGGERPPMDSYVSHHWPVKLQELMKRCWSSNPELRPTFSEINIQLTEIIDDCLVSGPDRVRRQHASPPLSSADIKPPAGGFASMKPLKNDQSRGHTIGSTPTSPRTNERRHWSFGFVTRSHPSNP